MNPNPITDTLVEVASGAWSELTDRLNLSPIRLVQHLGLFLVISLIYASYLKGFIDYAEHGNQAMDDKTFYWSVIKLICSVGWPFLVLSMLDKEWTRIDTQRVAVAAYVVCLLFWLHRYNLKACALGSMMLFVPLFFSAIASHWLGAWRSRRR